MKLIIQLLHFSGVILKNFYLKNLKNKVNSKLNQNTFLFLNKIKLKLNKRNRKYFDPNLEFSFNKNKAFLIVWTRPCLPEESIEPEFFGCFQGFLNSVKVYYLRNYKELSKIKRVMSFRFFFVCFCFLLVSSK